MNCLAVHLNPRLCRLCHQLALHSGLCLSRLRRPLLQLAARLLYLVAQALLQSTPLFSRHLRRQHAQGQVLNPTRHLRRHLYLVAQALLQSTPLFSRHLRRQQSQGQVLNPTRPLWRHLRSQKASGKQRGAKRATRSIGGTRSLGRRYGSGRGFPELLLQSTAQQQHQL